MLRQSAGDIPLQSDLALMALGLLFVLAWDASGLDLVLARHIGTAQGFAWRDAFITGTAIHKGGPWLARAALLWLAIGVLHALPPARDVPRVERLWCLLTTLSCLAAIALIKQASMTSCPWSLSEFGGPAHYVPHLRWGVADGGPGHCFPSGHASAAFAFFPAYFIFRPRRPRAAAAWLATVCVLGALLGWSQTMRGAHYLGDSLYTAWFCWSMTVVSYRWFAWRRARHGDGGRPALPSRS